MHFPAGSGSHSLRLGTQFHLVPSYIWAKRTALRTSLSRTGLGSQTSSDSCLPPHNWNPDKRLCTLLGSDLTKPPDIPMSDYMLRARCPEASLGRTWLPEAPGSVGASERPVWLSFGSCTTDGPVTGKYRRACSRLPGRAPLLPGLGSPITVGTQ